MRSRHKRLGLAAALLVTVAPWPSWQASASCAGPYLKTPGSRAAPPVLVRGSSNTIEGRAFVDGCNDTGGSDAWGCSSDEGETESPMEDIMLTIRQGQRKWQLGSEDAGNADDNKLGHVSWEVTIPRALKPGRATLATESSEPVPVVVRTGLRVAVPSHCGVLGVSVDGRMWLAEPPLGDHNPPEGWDENRTEGYLVETKPGRAVFYGDAGQRAPFRLGAPGADDPNADCE